MYRQKGQTLLIVVLVIIAAATIGLSILSRTIVSQKSSTEETESQKALAAAEAGIERAIQGNVTISSNGDIGNNSTYDTAVTQLNAASFLLNGGAPIYDSPPPPQQPQIVGYVPNLVQKDEGTDVWFAEHKTDGSGGINYATVKSPAHVNLYWGTTSETCTSGSMPAAIEAIVIAGTSPGTAKTYRYVYDCSSSRGNNFKPGLSVNNSTDKPITGVTFGYRTPDLDLANGIGGNIILIRVVPLYKDTRVAISTSCGVSGDPCISLPSPGSMIDSKGTSGQATSRITDFKPAWPQTYLPYLSYGLFVAN